MRQIASGDELDPMYKDHPLTGNHKGKRACHVGSDWVVIYILKKKDNEVVFVRTGTHADLFGK